MAGYSSMMFSVRPTIVLKLLGQMCGLLAALTCVPLTVVFIYGNIGTAVCYLVVILIFTLFGFIGHSLPRPTYVQLNESLTVVALIFIFASLLMSLPIMSYGIGFVDAWFEAASGITTTGLSTLVLDESNIPLLFGRGWMQWVGGIGVVVLALAIFVAPGALAQSLGFTEREMGDVVGGTKAHAKRVIIIYISLTAIGIIALLCTGASVIDALVHCMSAVSTGGFANYTDSLSSRSMLHIQVVNVLCICGAVSFHVYYFSLLAWRRNKSLDNQLIALLVLILAFSFVTILLAIFTGTDLFIGDVLTLFVSAQTTAGFSSMPLNNLPSWLLILVSLSMAIGGGVGSTSGGIKLGRLLFIIQWTKLFAIRTAVPSSTYISATGRAKQLDQKILEDVIVVTSCFFIVLLLSWMVFLVYGYPPIESLFEVTSALATAGLSAGVAKQDLPDVLKIVLCIDMLFGRLEMLALFILFLPRTWVGRRRSSKGNRL